MRATNDSINGNEDIIQDEAQIHCSVTFRHTNPTPALKNYATEKISDCLRKYIHGDNTEVQIILSVEKRDHLAEAIVHSKRYDLVGKAVTEDLYSAIDAVVDTLETQIRKQKEKLVNHKHQPNAR